MTQIDHKTVNEIWNEIESLLNDNPVPFTDLNVVYQFDLTGEDGGTYQLVLSENIAKVFHNTSNEPQCTLKMKVSDFKKFLQGNMNSAAAFMMGKLKVEGSMGLALKLEKLLEQYELKVD
jgi:putative sterol carrier protein